MEEMEKLIKEINKTKKDFKRIRVKDPKNKGGLLVLTFERLSTEKVVFYYEQANNGLPNNIQAKKRFKQQMKLELNKFDTNITNAKKTIEELGPYYKLIPKVKKCKT